jgi:hypothetical protein
MRKILCLYLFIYNIQIFSQQVIILGKNEKYIVQAGKIYSFNNRLKQSFYNEVTQYFAKLKVSDTIIIIETPPIDWGKRVNSSNGEIKYNRAFKSGFVCNLLIRDLQPHHEYILTLNGRPDLAGNDLLTDTVPGSTGKIEKYYDFDRVTTDSNGDIKIQYGIMLKTGSYHIRFYVKDAYDFKIVLYHDYFRFEVE